MPPVASGGAWRERRARARGLRPAAPGVPLDELCIEGEMGPNALDITGLNGRPISPSWRRPQPILPRRLSCRPKGRSRGILAARRRERPLGVETRISLLARQPSGPLGHRGQSRGDRAHLGCCPC